MMLLMFYDFRLKYWFFCSYLVNWELHSDIVNYFVKLTMCRVHCM